jgi:hypothetical protein
MDLSQGRRIDGYGSERSESSSSSFLDVWRRRDIGSFFALVLGAQSPGAILTIDDSALRAVTTTIGGAPVLPTTRTVAHWWGSTLDPHDGVTYGYNFHAVRDGGWCVSESSGIHQGTWRSAVTG